MGLVITTAADVASRLPGKKSWDDGLTDYERAALRAFEATEAGGAQLQPFGVLDPMSNTRQRVRSSGNTFNPGGMLTNSMTSAPTPELAPAPQQMQAEQQGQLSLGQPFDQPDLSIGTPDQDRSLGRTGASPGEIEQEEEVNLLEEQSWYTNPTEWNGEIDTKNLGMSGLDEEDYRLFRSRLNSLNWNYEQGNLDDQEYQSSFEALSEDMGVPTMVEGTDKIYWLDPGSGMNPYGVNIAGNFGDRPGMFIRDARTDGDFSVGSFVENVGDYVTSPQGLLNLGLAAATGGQSLWGSLGDFARGAAITGLTQGEDTNYGVDDPLENAEGPMIGDTPVMSRPGWEWVRDASSISGWKAAPVEEQEDSGGGGGADSGSEDGGSSGGQPSVDIDPERPWLYQGNGVFTNVLTGESMTQEDSGNYTEGEYYSSGQEETLMEEDPSIGVLVPGYTGDIFSTDPFGDTIGDGAIDGDGVDTGGTGDSGNGTSGSGSDGGDSSEGGELVVGPSLPGEGYGEGADGTGEGDGGDGAGEGEGSGNQQAMPPAAGVNSQLDFDPFQAGISYNVPMLSRVNLELRNFLAELYNRG